uniref:Uncharacterized protein n=1 Tax=Rangifer tarandus platyrhynchus TaxID=3082113 RepID=A0ACB0F0B3_RANTA|nr:unnamed protein product [Rangifer tarandus platyrhynchus]
MEPSQSCGKVSRTNFRSSSRVWTFGAQMSEQGPRVDWQPPGKPQELEGGHNSVHSNFLGVCMADSLISPAEAAESPLAGFATLPAVGPSVRLSRRMSRPWALDLEKTRQAQEHRGHCVPLAPEQPDRVPGAEEQSVLLAQNTALERTADLVREVDPNEQLDEDVEEMLLQIADDFIESVVTAACQLAQHRKSSTLEVKDVQLHLERQWNMWIPGFGSEEI